MDLAKLLRSQWDRAAAVLALGVGVLALVLGYIGVSSTAYTAEQMPYLISGGIAGVFLLGLAATLYLSADIRDEWRKLDAIDQKLAGLESNAVPADIQARLAAVESQLAKRPTSRSTAAAAATGGRKAATRVDPKAEMAAKNGS